MTNQFALSLFPPRVDFDDLQYNQFTVKCECNFYVETQQSCSPLPPGPLLSKWCISLPPPANSSPLVYSPSLWRTPAPAIGVPRYPPVQGGKGCRGRQGVGVQRGKWCTPLPPGEPLWCTPLPPGQHPRRQWCTLLPPDNPLPIASGVLSNPRDNTLVVFFSTPSDYLFSSGVILYTLDNPPHPHYQWWTNQSPGPPQWCVSLPP